MLLFCLCSACGVRRAYQAENVLLDEKEEAVVADYGTASELALPGPKRALSHAAPGEFRTVRLWLTDMSTV